MDVLPGRSIDADAYAGLAKRLSTITLRCHALIQASDGLSEEDLICELEQIINDAREAMSYAGLTEDEIRAMRQYVLRGFRSGRQ